jgi:hypothetical protein
MEVCNWNLEMDNCQSKSLDTEDTKIRVSDTRNFDPENKTRRAHTHLWTVRVCPSSTLVQLTLDLLQMQKEQPIRRGKPKPRGSC